MRLLNIKIVVLLILPCFQCQDDNIEFDTLIGKYGEEFQLILHQKIILTEEANTDEIVDSLIVELTSLNDVRCPADVCITEGYAEISFKLIRNGIMEKFKGCIGRCSIPYPQEYSGFVSTDSLEIQLNQSQYLVLFKGIVPHRKEYYNKGKTPNLHAVMEVHQQ